MIKVITVVSPENQKFEINFHRTADLCWSCEFPAYARLNERILPVVHGSLALYSDYIEDKENGARVYHSTSLERVMAMIADYLGQTEF